MAKTKKLNTTLLIAELPPDMAKILESYKERHGIKVNTTATIQMVREHPGLVAQNLKQHRRILELEQQLRDITHHLYERERHEKLISKTLKQINL